MDIENKDVINENTQVEEIGDVEETSKIEIDPKKIEKESSALSAKKSFRITEENKKKSDLLEKELQPENANAYFESLINALIEVRNAESAVYSQDHRAELLDLLVRIVEIYDQVVRRNDSKTVITMSRYQDKIDELSNSLDKVTDENNKMKEKHQEELSSINSKHVLEISELKLSNKNLEQSLDTKDKEIKESSGKIKEMKNTISSLETKLSSKTTELADITSANKDKDKLLVELSDKNKELSEQALEQIKKINTLELKNGELDSKVKSLNDKLETTIAFQNQQKDLYEQQINTYKELLANKNK